MDATFDTAQSGALADLTPLGKCIEHLRIQRGLSKQALARQAGTSRQQLWRVMTGKSELTDQLGLRLAKALGVDPRALADVEEEGGADAARRLAFGGAREAAPLTFDAYLDLTDALRTTLRSLPSDATGRQLKRDLLDSIEERAHARGLRLPAAFFLLRGEVINGDL